MTDKAATNEQIEAYRADPVAVCGPHGRRWANALILRIEQEQRDAKGSLQAANYWKARHDEKQAEIEEQAMQIVALGQDLTAMEEEKQAEIEQEQAESVRLRAEWFKKGERAALNKTNSCVCIFTDPGDDLDRECSYHKAQREQQQANYETALDAIQIDGKKIQEQQAEIERLKKDLSFFKDQAARLALSPVAEIERLREALEKIRDELGVPQPGYPQPVANAADIARAALGKGE